LATLGARLALAAEAFLVERDDARSIIAGYPWFADWGRDAMISIPGLCLALGRIDDAEAVLRAFAAHQRDGLIPNRFPDHGGEVPSDHYNAADASLWFVEAVAALHDAGGDTRAFRQAVHTVLHAYRTGTRFGIRLEPDGLVRQGEEGVQLTWMDGKVDGWVVTPRAGRAVEINALWYNALVRATDLARAWGDDPGEYGELARRARSAFRAFWNPEARCLFDVIGDDGRPDPALRPNQLFAVSLPHSRLTRAQMRGAVDAVHRARLHRPLPRGAARARRGLSLRHGVAVAARAVRRGLPARPRHPSQRARARACATRAGDGPHHRVRPRPHRGGGRRRPAARARRLLRPGLELRRGAPHPVDDPAPSGSARTRPPLDSVTPWRSSSPCSWPPRPWPPSLCRSSPGTAPRAPRPLPPPRSMTGPSRRRSRATARRSGPAPSASAARSPTRRAAASARTAAGSWRSPARPRRAPSAPPDARARPQRRVRRRGAWRRAFPHHRPAQRHGDAAHARDARGH